MKQPRNDLLVDFFLLICETESRVYYYNGLLQRVEKATEKAWTLKRKLFCHAIKNQLLNQIEKLNKQKLQYLNHINLLA